MYLFSCLVYDEEPWRVEGEPLHGDEEDDATNDHPSTLVRFEATEPVDEAQGDEDGRGKAADQDYDSPARYEVVLYLCKDCLKRQFLYLNRQRGTYSLFSYGVFKPPKKAASLGLRDGNWDPAPIAELLVQGRVWCPCSGTKRQ